MDKCHWDILQVSSPGPNGTIYTDLILSLPRPGFSIVLFSNGGPQGHFDEAHRHVASMLKEKGFGTCHLRAHEDPETGTKRSAALPLNNYSLQTIAEILLTAADAMAYQKELAGARISLFGSGEGAAASMYAATQNPGVIFTMVLSGARLSSALSRAAQNAVPTLFIVGSEDYVDARSTRAAFATARGPKELVVIEGSGHLLREPGALEAVSDHTTRWILQHSCTQT